MRADLAQNCLLLSIFAAALLSAKVMVYLRKSQPASAVSLNSSQQLLLFALSSKPEPLALKIDRDMIFPRNTPFCFAGPGLAYPLSC